MYLLDTLCVLDHLHLGDVVGPCRISQQFRDLAAQVEELCHNRFVNR